MHTASIPASERQRPPRAARFSCVPTSTLLCPNQRSHASHPVVYNTQRNTNNLHSSSLRHPQERRPPRSRREGSKIAIEAESLQLAATTPRTGTTEPLPPRTLHKTSPHSKSLSRNTATPNKQLCHFAEHYVNRFQKRSGSLTAAKLGSLHEVVKMKHARSHWKKANAEETRSWSHKVVATSDLSG